MHWVTDERLRSRCGNCFTHAFTASNKPPWFISVLAISQHLLFFTVNYWACFRDSNYVCFRHFSKWWRLGGLPWILTFSCIQPVIIPLLVAGLSLLSPCLHTHAVLYSCSCKTAWFLSGSKIATLLPGRACYWHGQTPVALDSSPVATAWGGRLPVLVEPQDRNGPPMRAHLDSGKTSTPRTSSLSAPECCFWFVTGVAEHLNSNSHHRIIKPTVLLGAIVNPVSLPKARINPCEVWFDVTMVNFKQRTSLLVICWPDIGLGTVDRNK